MSELPYPSARALQRLLQRLSLTVDTPVLHQACAGQDGSLPVADWLRQVLKQCGQSTISPALLQWRRFDPRRLPGLVYHQQQWWLAERDAAGQLLLTDDNGAIHTATDEELQDARVLWLRIPPSRAFDSLPSLHCNLAARLVWQALFHEQGWLGKVVIATVLVNLLAVATSLFAMQVYDRVVPTLAYATLTTLVAGMLLVILLDWLLKTIRARIIDSLACAVDKRVSRQVFDHLLYIRLDALPPSLGTLAAQVNGLDAVRQFFSSGIVFALIDLPFALFFITMIAVIGGKVGWVYALLLPLVLVLGLFTQWRLRELLRKQLVRSNERQGLLVDSIRGAESIRANHAGWRFAEEWQDLTDSVDAYNIRQKAISTFSSVTTASLSTLAYVGAVVVGVWQIEAGVLTMGGLIACSILGGRVIAPVAQSVQYLVQWQHVSQALKMVHMVLALPRERRPDQHLVLPDQPPASVTLEQLRFAYGDAPVRQLDIDRLDLRAGERVLLVGPVGCGKSTLLKLLAGLYRPGEGRIRLDDADLWEIDPQMLTSFVGYLPQSPQLFKGTLRSNLGLAGSGSDSQLLSLARQLGIDDIAAGSPQGLDLPISEGGEGLSGGQRQLVALGRVMLARPRIWLLDEPTASLDNDSEQRLWQVLGAAVQPEDIVLMATHRPMMAARLATRVLVMQRGKIIQDGSPGQVLPALAARSGVTVRHKESIHVV